MTALQDVKKRVATRYGRPRVAVHGSKHLTAAFLFGRVFAPFQMDIRQTPIDTWGTDGPAVDIEPFEPRTCRTQGLISGVIYVEIASGSKDIQTGVDLLLAARSVVKPAVRLQLRPYQPLNVDNDLCRAMARQAYSEIERVVAQIGGAVTDTHLFVAAPQAFMMMLG